MRRWLILIPLSFPLCGQFAELASTDDGKQVYFTTALQFSGAPVSRGEVRIYRIAENGLELFEDVPDASGFLARSPQVSADGRTVGFTLNAQAELRGLRAAVLGPAARLSMSRNAQWATLTGIAGPPPANAPPPSILINLGTGERTRLPQPVAAPFPIASDGTVVLQGGLWRQGSITPHPLRGPFAIFAISDNAGVLVYLQLFDFPANPQQRLVARDISTGRETVVFSRPSAPGFIGGMGLSNDGLRLLYRVGSSNAGQAFVANTMTGESAAVPLPEGELATDGALSGNGTAAFLVTATGRIVGVDLANGSVVRTLVPPTPYVPDFPTLVPGSLVRLTGTLPRMADVLRGRMFLDDVALPILFANDKEIGVQVPWEVNATGQPVFRLEIAGESPFHQNQSVSNRLRPMFPRFEPLGVGETSVLGFKAVRGDFSGLLTANLHPGDIFTVYATGLGPVIGAVQTGQPAPLDRTVPIQGQFRCRFDPYRAEAETLFAGLAPGTIGIYQVNFRLPPGPDPGPITGGLCVYNGPGVDGGFTWIVGQDR